MARKRMIDPNIWQSEDVAKLTVMGRYLFIGMISNADDEGKGRANPNYLKSMIFPYDDMRVAEVEKALSEISHNTSVQFYQVGGNQYYRFLNWAKWQKVEKPSPSMIPDPENADEINESEAFPERSPKAPRTFPDESRLIEENRREENRIKEKDKREKPEPDGSTRPPVRRFVKPTIEEVTSFCKEQKLSKVNPQDFWDYYESNGWKVGKQTMKDWHAAIRRWDRNEYSPASKAGGKRGGFTDYPQREYSEEELADLFEEVDRF